MMKCIVIEDEPLAMERVRSYIARIPSLRLINTFDNGTEALLYLQNHEVDLVFLDINLGDMSGIRLLETAALKCSVIVTTAYDKYALKGYELKVTDYLLKPFTFERFFAAFSRVKEISKKPLISSEKKFLFVKTEHRLEKVPLDDILYVEGMRDYRRIHTQLKKIMTSQTFGSFEAEVPAYILCRVHKSWMVSLNKIDSIERDCIQIGSATIPISDTYKERLFDLIRTI